MLDPVGLTTPKHIYRLSITVEIRSHLEVLLFYGGKMNGESDFTFNNFNIEDVIIHCTNGLYKLSFRKEVQTNTILGLWPGPILLSAEDGRL